MDMKHFIPGHLYECYEENGKKFLARFERSMCAKCGYVWNVNTGGEDCPKCSGDGMLIFGSFAEALIGQRWLKVANDGKIT